MYTYLFYFFHGSQWIDHKERAVLLTKEFSIHLGSLCARPCLPQSGEEGRDTFKVLLYKVYPTEVFIPLGPDVLRRIAVTPDQGSRPVSLDPVHSDVALRVSLFDRALSELNEGALGDKLEALIAKGVRKEEFGLDLRLVNAEHVRLESPCLEVLFGEYWSVSDPLLIAQRGYLRRNEPQSVAPT